MEKEKFCDNLLWRLLCLSGWIIFLVLGISIIRSGGAVIPKVKSAKESAEKIEAYLANKQQHIEAIPAYENRLLELQKHIEECIEEYEKRIKKLEQAPKWHR